MIFDFMKCALLLALVLLIVETNHQQTALLLRIAKAQEATLAVLRQGVKTEINWSIPMELPPCVGER